MPGSRKDEKKPFAFWLVERMLPRDEENEEQESMSDGEFYFGLVISLVLVVAAGVLIRGCTL